MESAPSIRAIWVWPSHKDTGQLKKVAPDAIIKHIKKDGGVSKFVNGFRKIRYNSVNSWERMSFFVNKIYYM